VADNFTLLGRRSDFEGDSTTESEITNTVTVIEPQDYTLNGDADDLPF
jgi:hypothetical protein